MHRLLIASCLLLPTLAGAADSGFESRYASARDAWKTSEGKTYAKSSSSAIQAALKQAQKDCPMPSIFSLMRGIEYRFVYSIRADGRLGDVAADPVNPSTRCAAGLLAKATFPAPPRADWPGAISIRINKKAPKD